MRLIELVNAKEALQKLIRQDLPIRTAYAVMELTDQCNRHLMFYGQELAKFDPDANPDRLEELNNMEVDGIRGEKIPISMDGSLRLSPTDVKMLLPFAEFV